MDEDSSIHRLEGSSGSEKGGLIIMKKGPSKDTEQHSFKKPDLPKVSLLGLDKLAAAKRKQADLNENAEQKRSKVLSYKNDWDNSEDVDDDSDDRRENRGPKERYVLYTYVKRDG